MDTILSPLEYLGIMVQGGNIIYFLINALFLFIILPQLQPKRNEATVAIHKSLGCLLLIYVFNYALWILPELANSSCGYYQVGRLYPDFNTFMEYMDLAILPLSMIFGSTVLLGRLPKKWLGTSIIVPYLLYAAIDISQILPFKLYTFAYISTIVLTGMQLAWYGYFIKKFDKKLMEYCSNIDRRSTRWVFWTLVPLFLLALLYIPMNILANSAEWMVLYDFMTMIFLTGIVGCALAHKIDDTTISLIKEQIEDLKPEDDRIEDFVEEKNIPVQQPVEVSKPETIEIPDAKAEEKTESTAAETHQTAPKQTASNPANDAKFNNFDETIQKMEADKFYLDTEVNIDWLSSKLGTNRHYVSDYLNQVKHVTFYEYVNTLRLNYAEQLLKEGKEKVADVAFISGFNSDHTFRRLFKEKYGCTPLQYQKSA